MIAQRVQIEKIRNVNVFHAELILLSAVAGTARRVIVDLDALHFKANVAMLVASIEFGVAIDEVDSGHMVRNKRENFFFCLLIDNARSVGVVVLQISV